MFVYLCLEGWVFFFGGGGGQVAHLDAPAARIAWIQVVDGIYIDTTSGFTHPPVKWPLGSGGGGGWR